MSMFGMPKEVVFVSLLFDRPSGDIKRRAFHCIIDLPYVHELDDKEDNWLITLDAKKFYSIHSVTAEIKNILEQPICPICYKRIVYKEQYEKNCLLYHIVCYHRRRNDRRKDK